MHSAAWRKWRDEFPDPVVEPRIDHSRYRRAVEEALDQQIPSAALPKSDKKEILKMLGRHMEVLERSAKQVSLLTKGLAGLTIVTGLVAPVIPPLVPVAFILGTVSAGMVFIPPQIGNPQAAGDQQVYYRLLAAARSLP